MVADAPSYSTLLHQLALACELEHGLCLQYLFTAYSLKSRLDEGGITAAELTSVRTWKANLLFIAAQEMLHLAQAGNLSAAVGSGLNLRRPNFPQRPSYYPTGLPWGLWPFSQSTLVLYALYERPTCFHADAPAWCPSPHAWDTGLASLMTDAPLHKDPFHFLAEHFVRPSASHYLTIAALYQSIAQGFQHAGQVIVGPPQAQVAGDMMDCPQLRLIFQRDDALAAIELIISEGEGAPADRVDSHFGMFVKIYEEYTTLKAQRADFNPARDVQANPLSRLHPDNTYPGWRVIQDSVTRQVNDLHNDVYQLMLHMLRYVFTQSDAAVPTRKAVAHVCLRLMTGLLVPLGETLTQLPMGLDDTPGSSTRARYAGPSFETEFTQLDLPFAAAAQHYFAEELGRLASRRRRPQAFMLGI